MDREATDGAMEALIERFADYLQASGSVDCLQPLVTALVDAGLELEAALLRAHAMEMAAVHVQNPWTEKAIALGNVPPAQPQLGECWFDPAELVICVFVVASDGWAARTGGWFSTHPVLGWQYLAFLKALRFEQSAKSAFPIFDLLGPVVDLRAPVTGMYSDAARIYACWFGKGLVGSNMEFVIAQLPTVQVHAIMPLGLNLWAFDGAYGREDAPLAYNLESVVAEDHLELLETEFPLEKKLVYDQWERSPWVGFTTQTEATGLVIPNDGVVWPWVRLLNSPRRQDTPN